MLFGVCIGSHFAAVSGDLRSAFFSGRPYCVCRYRRLNSGQHQACEVIKRCPQNTEIIGIFVAAGLGEEFPFKEHAGGQCQRKLA